MLLLALLMVGGVFLAGWMATEPGLKPVVISVYEPPIIRPDETTHWLGDILTDSKAQHVFHVYNVGGKKLVIDRVEASCGCTVADISKKSIPPGDVAALTVTLDTSIKIGPVKKKITVYSNDPQQPELALYLKANVKPQMKGHEPIAVKDPLVLFKGQCATCHVLKGKGKSGKALFQADCGMCHGLNAQGAVAPTLLTQNYADPAVAAKMRDIIANGAPDNPEMAPFSQAKGGPLNEAEIDSLVNFLTYQADQAKQGLLDKDGNPLVEEEE
jgi:mono/diheme cytochrome c family protein